MDRRTFIKGSVIAAATPGVVSSADSVEHSTLLALIAKHENLYAVDSELWAHVYAIDDGEAMQTAPKVFVQIAKMLDGHDADGNEVFKPILAWRRLEIMDHYKGLLDNVKYEWAGPHTAERQEARRLQIEARRQEKLDEFEACEAMRKRHEDRCGYTAAIEAARASTDEVRGVEGLIIKFVPNTLEEAAIKAQWVVKKMNDDRSYLNDYENAMEEALDAIGKGFVATA